MKFFKNLNCLALLLLGLLILFFLSYGTGIIEGHSNPLQLLHIIKEQNIDKIKKKLNNNNTEASMIVDLDNLNKEFRYQEIINMAIKYLSNSTVHQNDDQHFNDNHSHNYYQNHGHSGDAALAAAASSADGSSLGTQMTLAPYDEAYD